MSRPREGAAEPPLALALPKGRILEEAFEVFARAGLPLDVLKKKSRKLVFEAEAPEDVGGALRIYVVRDADVPTYVEYGAADFGIAGRDVLEEQGRDLYEPIDLRIGRCRLCLAEREDRHVDDGAPLPRLGDEGNGGGEAGGREGELHLRVATKFPNLTRRHLEARGIVAEVIKLYGSIELAPLTGLSDWIVDLVSTGETLKQNHLRVVETLMEVSARLVVNRASLKLRGRQIDALLARLRAAVEPS